MSEVVGEARIVLNADTALLIKQIESLPAIPVKVKPTLDKSAVKREFANMEITPDFRLTTKAHENLRNTIQSAIREATKESKVFLLTGARFALGKEAKNSIQREIRTSITEASKLDKEFMLTNTRFGIGQKTKTNLVKNIRVAVKEAAAIVNADPTGLVVQIDKAPLIADAEKDAIAARERMQLIFLKPINAFIDADISKAVSAFSRFEVVSKRVFKNIGLAWGVTTTAIVAGTAAIGVAAVRSFAELESSATNAASLIAGTDLTGGKTLAQARKTFDSAKEEFITGAQEIAKRTVFSAKEAADGYYFLASAGESAKDSLALLPQIAKFAQAGQFDLQQSTEGLLQSFNALGLNFGDFATKQKNITHLTDVLTNANVRSITDLQNLSDALKNRAAVSFTQYGQSVETAVAALEQFSSVGITGLKAGQQAGITIREIFTKGAANEKDWKRQGLAVFDAAGNYRKFGDIIADFKKKFDSLNPRGQTKLFKALDLTDRSTQGLRALIQAEGKANLSGLVTQLEKSQGITEEIAGLQQTSLSAVFQNFKDAINSLLVESGKIPGAKLAQFFDSFNKGNQLSKIATKAFAGLGVELGKLTDKLLSFVNGPGLIAIGKGLKDLAEGTFKGLAGFGKQFAETFGGKNLSTGEAFGLLLSKIGDASANIFPKVGHALGEFTNFLIDNQKILITTAKAWIELSAAIFAIRVIILPLQQIFRLASGLVTVLGGGEGLAGVLELFSGVGLRFLGIFGLIATVFIETFKNSEDFRNSLGETGQVLLDVASDTFKLIGSLTSAGKKIPFVGDAFKLFGHLAAHAVREAIVPLKLLDATLKSISDLLNGRWSKAWHHFSGAAIDAANVFTFNVVPSIIGGIHAIRAEIDGQGFQNGLNNLIKLGKGIKPVQGPLVNAFKPVQGPGLGGRDVGAHQIISDRTKLLGDLNILDKKAEAASEKIRKERERRLKAEGAAALSAENKIKAALKSTNAEIQKNELGRKNTLKDYFEAVSRAADKAKQDVIDFGDAITQSLIGNLDPLKAQGAINNSLDELFKTLRQNMGVLAGSDTERARTNLDALSSALSSIGEAAKGIAQTQGPGAVGGFLNTQIGTLLQRAQDAFATGQLSADQLKQLQDQANASLAAAGQVKIPIKLEAVDADGNPVTDPRKNGIIARFDMLHAQLIEKSKNLSAALGKAAVPNGKALIVGFTDGVREEWTNSAKPYLADLGKQIPNGLGGTLVLQQSMTPHGEAIMLGLQQGMKTVWRKDVTKFIKNVAPWIAANKGPIATDAGLLVPHGAAIMGGLLDGLKAGWSIVMNFIKSTAAQITASTQAIASSIAGTLGGMFGASDNTGGAFQGKFAKLINAQAKKFKIDPLLLGSIIKAESGFNPNAVSPVGAQGLGQLMPATARGLGVSNPFDPKQNIMGTAKYISQLLEHFGGNIKNAVAAYNAGPNAVERAGGVPHFTETQNYVANVLKYLQEYKAQTGKVDTNTAGFPFPLGKTAILAATMNLDGANRLLMGAVGATAQESGLHVTAGKNHHSIYTSSGKLSDHGKGKALDVASGSAKVMADYAEFARRWFKPAQLIYSPLGESFNGGSWTPITDSGLKAEHYSHVHVGRPKMLEFINDVLKGKIKGGRAMGGSHESGTYLVGERGPELRSFGNKGEIISNANLNRMLKQMEKNSTGDGGVTVNIGSVTSNASNPSVVAAQVGAQIRGRMIPI